ncbi:hypothetical protein L198_07832 [Cryptococcus wingfieldii CBS 7118]|uniref:Uncharacterized protein n=1 Tax=Cryptococcus wingfieldii CBS 7118 TaxID=1295528 RepID=A0A1E3HWM6_9TREE|nr:hypothetical protein L198_07832 [Cryptococcus wingfieldii CBS 7118]ODN80176.1 hypothetical protein L198_07832 [Cryptococcus wingfieldii CBS 7118]
MFFSTPKFLLALFTTTAATSASVIEPRAETHNVKLVNKCGSGTPVFLYQGNGQRGGGTVNGALQGGIAWLDGYKNCQSSGVNCGVVEFTLINKSHKAANGYSYQNSADYSLLDGPGLGNHKYQYKMDFAFNGAGCNKGPGACTGNSAAKCPGAYLGSATAGGAPIQCAADNVGITITFC